MSDQEEQEPGGRESAYLLVILLMAALCVALFSWGRLQGVAMEAAKKEAAQHKQEVARLHRQIREMRKRAKALAARPVLPPRARPLHHGGYRSLVPAIPPGLLLGSPLHRPGGAAIRKPASPRPAAPKLPAEFYSSKRAKRSLTLHVVPRKFRYRGKVRRISLAQWRKAGSWSAAFRERIETIVIKDVSVRRPGQRALRLFPRLRTLRLQNLAVGGAPLSAKDFPSSLKTLQITTVSGYMRGLCEKPLPHLKSLTLSKLDLMDDRAMRCVGLMPKLQTLVLHQLYMLSDRGVRLLIKGHKLRALTIDGCKKVNGVGLIGLATHKGLQVLHLRNLPRFDDAGLRYLAGMPRLRDVSLRNTAITGVAFRFLSKLSQLRTLKLDGSQFSNQGAAALPLWPRLRHLSAKSTKLRGAGAAPIGRLSGLLRLHLGSTNISDASAAGLGRLKRLRHLDLSHTKIGNGGVIHLQGAVSLQFLSLFQARVTDKVAPALANLKRLGRLNLGKTMFTEKGVRFLASNMRALRWLQVSAMMPATSIRAFRRKFPGLRILDLQ